MKRHVGGRSAELGSTSLDLLAPVEKVEVESKHSQACIARGCISVSPQSTLNTMEVKITAWILLIGLL